MKQVKLKDGFALHVRDNVMDDMELLDDLVELDGGNGYAISKILNRILDKDEKKKLYDHLRKDGVTPVTSVTAAMKEIFDSLGAEGKN